VRPAPHSKPRALSQSRPVERRRQRSSSGDRAFVRADPPGTSPCLATASANSELELAPGRRASTGATARAPASVGGRRDQLPSSHSSREGSSASPSSASAVRWTITTNPNPTKTTTRRPPRPRRELSALTRIGDTARRESSWRRPAVSLPGARSRARRRRGTPRAAPRGTGGSASARPSGPEFGRGTLPTVARS